MDRHSNFMDQLDEATPDCAPNSYEAARRFTEGAVFLASLKRPTELSRLQKQAAACCSKCGGKDKCQKCGADKMPAKCCGRCHGDAKEKAEQGTAEEAAEKGEEKTAAPLPVTPPGVNRVAPIPGSDATKGTGFVPVQHIRPAKTTAPSAVPMPVKQASMEKDAIVESLIRGVAQMGRKVTGGVRETFHDANEYGIGYIHGLGGHRDASGELLKEPGAWTRLKGWNAARKTGVRDPATMKWADQAKARGGEYHAGYRSGKQRAQQVGAEDLLGELHKNFRRPDGKLTTLSVIRGLESSGMLNPETIRKARDGAQKFVSDRPARSEKELKGRAIAIGAGAGVAAGGGGFLLARKMYKPKEPAQE